MPAHHSCKCSDLQRCLAFHAQSEQDRPYLRLGRPAVHDYIHDPGCFFSCQVLVVCQPVDGIAEPHCPTPVIQRKFLMMRSPSRDRMLSGWNWTPSIGYFVWRTPMT